VILLRKKSRKSYLVDSTGYRTPHEPYGHFVCTSEGCWYHYVTVLPGRAKTRTEVGQEGQGYHNVTRVRDYWVAIENMS
jgi:hypothetical protein